MAPFQYTTDRGRHDISGLKDPDADPFISGDVSPAHDPGLGDMLGRAQSDSDSDPELEQEPQSSFDELFTLTHDVASPFSTTMSPSQQRSLVPLKCPELHGQISPSTDSSSSTSSSSVMIPDTPNTYSRKRKSADSISSFGPPLNNYTSISDQYHQNKWARPSNSPWEQDTKDTVQGINRLYMESAGVSPSSSLTSSGGDNQDDILGVSIPTYSSESSNSSPLEMPRSQNQGVSHPYPQDFAYLGANMDNTMINNRYQPVKDTTGLLRQLREPGKSGQPRPRQQYTQLKVISAQNVQYAPLNFIVLANQLDTRVETSLDIRLELIQPPRDINKLRMHKSHLYKAKNQAQSDDTSLDPDTVEVRAVVFCAEALKNRATQTRDPEKEAQAMSYVRALVEANEDSPTPSPPNPGTYLANKLEAVQTPCTLCIGREYKRLTRGPQKTKAKSKGKSKATGSHPDKANSTETDGQEPDKVESEQMNKEVSRASHRIVTMQVKTQALVDWQLPTSQTTDSAAQLMRAPPAPLPHSDSDNESSDADGKKKKKLPLPPVDEGTIAVDMALRICCYGRHIGENEGYCLIFALVDHQRKVVGLTITDPFNINDNHKEKKNKDDDKNKKIQSPKPVIQTQGLPGEGVFPQQPGTSVFPQQPSASVVQPQLLQSRSAPNLSAMPQDFNFQQVYQTFIYNYSTPPELNNIPNNFPPVPATIAPNRSRAASPSAAGNPAKRQRAKGNDWRVPNNLMMTPIPSEPARPKQQTATFNFHTLDGANFNNMNHAHLDGNVNAGGHLSGGVHAGNFPGMEERPTYPGYCQNPSTSGMRQLQTGNRTNPTSPRPFTPTVLSVEDGDKNSKSDHGSGLQSPQNNAHGYVGAAQAPHYQMHDLHNDEADPRQQTHGFNINPPNGIPQGFPINQPNGVTNAFPVNQPNGAAHRFPINPPNRANYIGPNTNTGYQLQAQQPQVLPPPALTLLHPNSGSTEGGDFIYILGAHLVPELRLFFGNRPATEVTVLSPGGLTCFVPRVNRPHRVPVNIMVNGRIIPPYDPSQQQYYTYVDAEDQASLQRAQPYLSGAPSSQINPGYNGGASIGGISQPQQHFQQDQGQNEPWGPQSTYMSRHGSPPASETPPSYEDATTPEQRDRFNLLRSKDQKTFSTLQAAGETMADHYATEMFDSPQAETSKAESSKAEASRVETSKAVTKSGKELSLLERKREVKGLRSDLKLWAIWIPILIVVLTIMLYTHAPAACSACLSKLGALF